MLIVKLWHYIRGYVIINVKGKYLERLINLVHHNNILIWDIIKRNKDCISAKIELKDLDSVNQLASKLSCQVELVKKKGLTLWKWKLKTRKIFAITFVLVLFAIFIVSSLLLTVEIKGNETMDVEEIKKELQILGLKPWIFKNSLDVNKLENDYLKEHKEVEFMNIEFNGTKAIVDIVEQEEQQEIYDKETPVDLIAKKGGIVKQILVINGTANVEVDQQVEEGDVLVKGEYFIQKDEKEVEIVYVHAMAQILAQTEYYKSYPVEKYKIINKDNYKINRVVHIGGLVINFLKDGEDNYYYGNTEEKKFKIFGLQLPITIDKILYYPKDNCIEKTKEELVAEVKDKATEEMRKFGKIQAIEIESTTEGNNTNQYKLKIVMLEDIIQEQMINKEE